MTKSLAQLIFSDETLYQTETLGQEATEKLIARIEPKPISTLAPALPQVVETVAEPPQNINLQHPVLILVQDLSEQDRQFLFKIIAAVGLQTEQVDIIELKKLPTFNRQAWVGQKVSKHFISFGIGLSKLGWQVLIPPYQIKKLEEVFFLLTDDLNTIANDVLLKKKLWALLQTMFPKV